MPFAIRVFEAPNTWFYGKFEISLPNALEVKVDDPLPFEV
jgi:hypothetical protein